MNFTPAPYERPNSDLTIMIGSLFILTVVLFISFKGGV